VSVYRDTAVVLGSYKFGEADRVVVLLTRNHGKIRAVAKGIRKTKSSIGARLEPMSHVDVSLRSGRDLDTIDQVRLVEPLQVLRSDFDRLRQGLSMVEAINKITPDREPVPHLFDLLTRGLHFLNQQSSPLLLASFFWRLISVEGASPQLDECVACNEGANLSYFDVQQGGVHCGACRSGVPISESAIEIIRWILGGKMNEALALSESIPVHEVNRLAMEAMEAHLERRLKSLGVFDRHL
jgi:DNA repair protein RecO (recombination protein O)